MDYEDLTIRPISGPEELDLFCQIAYVLNDELTEDLAEGRRRAEWMWVALRGERLAARVAWWGHHNDTTPSYLDIVDVDDAMPTDQGVIIGLQLLKSASAKVITGRLRPPEYIRFLPPDWRNRVETTLKVNNRMNILQQSGARLLVERLGFEWRREMAIAEPSERLFFRPLRNTDEILALMTLTLDDTLDAHSKSDLDRMTASEVATNHYQGELSRYPTPREWWRVATLSDGSPVGFVIPAHNYYHYIIAYIAVLPHHRGNGYIDDILAEGTRILSAHDAECIRASTDLYNTPMASAFVRAGWENFQRTINMTWIEDSLDGPD